MNKSALLVIDVQNGLFETPGFDLFKKDEVIRTIKSLISQARVMNVPIIYVQHDGGVGSPLEKKTRGWHIHQAILPINGDTVVEKTTPDSFFNTKLQEVLDLLEIEKLYIVGLQTEFCVDTTCRRAKSQGFKNVLIGDAHSTFDTEVLSAKDIIKHHNRTLTRFADVVDAKELEFAAQVNI